MDGESQRKRSRAASGAGMDVTCSLAQRPLVDTNEPTVAAMTLRCGVNEEYVMFDAVRGVIGALVKLFYSLVAVVPPVQDTECNACRDHLAGTQEQHAT